MLQYESKERNCYIKNLFRWAVADAAFVAEDLVLDLLLRSINQLSGELGAVDKS